MNYKECFEAVRDNKHLEGKYLTVDLNVTDKINDAEYRIIKVAIVPSDNESYKIFFYRFNETNQDFEKAIKPHISSKELIINLFVENLKGKGFAFLHYGF